MDLVSLLAARFGRLTNPTLDELKEALLGIPDLAEWTLPHVTEPSAYPYGRNVVYANEEVEIIVVHLPAQCRTYIHDHGKSAGCGRVVQGELTNAVFEAVDRTTAVKTAEHKVAAGERFVTPHGMIHQMRNDNQERVVSVHVYSPPLQGLKLYEERQETAFVT
ncbi:cysteine dioxygenase [Cohnella caldifontis]|uniref:cysteine dioxygenase n=1 Tax=Cohnella caldifontis TaxID=3027471 RepID=UPI0023EC798C|nr:cysteine dioxygenase family protein [Cohnella sp. YIM B05605]